MGLFATMPVEEVTVQDIAGAVEMTSAAVYYHFASKEQILLEGIEQFGDRLLEMLRGQVAEIAVTRSIPALVSNVLAWTSRHRTAATVYFVQSLGLNLMVEALRRETRVGLIDILRSAVKAARPKYSSAELGVTAVALVSLLETALASMLNQDATYRSLGARRFTVEVGQIAERIVGPG